MRASTPRSAWSELERVALMGTRREPMELPQIAPALDEFLAGLGGADAEHALLSAAGTLDLYEQIGRVPARTRPETGALPPADTLPPCPPRAADCLAQMLAGSLGGLMPEFLTEMERAGLRIPDTLLPNMLAYGYKRAALRPLILAVLGRRGRWLAAHHDSWRYAALDAGRWSTIRKAWEQSSAVQRPHLVNQLRAENPEQGRALVESVWRAENDQRRLQLIRPLETGLSMADEPLLESALDDRSRLVRRKAAELLARLPDSRLCRRMSGYVPRYLAWTPQETRQITVSLPKVTPEMRRNGIVGAQNQKPARVRSQEIIQLVGGVPLDYWQDHWGIDLFAILRAIPTTSWPRTLTSGFSQAAVRQNNAAWAQAIIEELDVTNVTMKLIPVLDSQLVNSLTLRALNEAAPGEFARNGALISLLRRRTDGWEIGLSQRLLLHFESYFRVTADARGPNHLVRELFLKFGRQTDPALFEQAAEALGDPEQLGCWRNTAVDFLHALRFRSEMREALGSDQ
jgi:hypothetical protein